MLPYVTLPVIHVAGPIDIQPFGLLVVTAIFVGTALARWRAPRLDIGRDELDSFFTWMLVGGFVGAHVLQIVFYHPEKILSDPLSLLRLWEGISSFGGIIGGMIGFLLWKRFRGGGQSVFAHADLVASVFPVAWIFGRAGCSVAHDHPGRLAESGELLAALAVQYPASTGRLAGLRYDLGLLEMFFSILLSVGLLFAWRKPRPVGTYLAIVCLTYAPVRFYMDFLRIAEPDGGDLRWLSLTFAQWSCVVVAGYGVYLVTRLRRTAAQAA